MSVAVPPRPLSGYRSLRDTSSAIDGVGYLTAAQLGLTLPLALPLGPPASRIQTNVVQVPGLTEGMLVFSASGGDLQIVTYYIDPRDPNNAPGSWPLVKLMPPVGPVNTTVYAGVSGANLIASFGRQSAQLPAAVRGEVQMFLGFDFWRTSGAAGSLDALRLWYGVR